MSDNQVKRVEKPWGYELIWAKTKDYVGKILHINAGGKLSLQYHNIKEETFYVSKGKMTLVYENEKGVMTERLMVPGDSHHMLPGKKHRMIGVEDCDVIEVSTNHLDDVVRLSDDYGREGTSKP
ncbi:MAG: hypothetical protein KA715_13370 [Xanthomonadaceae bacterium]|nr:hypothetical protein [Xanthomonadaceae bacterium]